MTQQQAQRANFGPSWPEVAGFGEGTPQQVSRRGKRSGKRILVLW